MELIALALLLTLVYIFFKCLISIEEQEEGEE